MTTTPHGQVPAAQGDIPDVVDVPAQCPYFGPSPHRDVWLEGWYAACATQPAAPQAAGKAVHQFRKQYCADWYDGRADHGDSGGPYEERTLYTSGAEPLTRQQLREAFYNDTACTLGGYVDLAEKVCRVVEKAHGIKGKEAGNAA